MPEIFEDHYGFTNQSLLDFGDARRVGTGTPRGDLEAALTAVCSGYRALENRSDDDARRRGEQGLRKGGRAWRQLLDNEEQRRAYDAAWEAWAKHQDPPPQLGAVDPIQLGDLVRGVGREFSVTLTNVGGGTLSGRAQPAATWVSVAPETFAFAATANLTVRIDTAALAPGPLQQIALLLTVDHADPQAVTVVASVVQNEPRPEETGADPAGGKTDGPTRVGDEVWPILGAAAGAAGFRWWSDFAIPPAPLSFTWVFTPRSVLAQLLGAVVLGLVWRWSSTRRRAFPSGSLVGQLAATSCLTVLIGAARWIWLPVDALDAALKPLAHFVGAPVAWGAGAGLLAGLVVVGVRSRPGPHPLRRAIHVATLWVTVVLILAHFGPQLRRWVTSLVPPVNQSTGNGAGKVSPPLFDRLKARRLADTANVMTEDVENKVRDLVRHPPPTSRVPRIRSDLRAKAIQAADLASDAIVADPTYAGGYVYRARGLRLAQRYREAREVARTGLPYAPNDVDLRSELRLLDEKLAERER